MLASATSIRSVSESIPVRFFALVTRASGILPRTTRVRSPRNSPSSSAMTITSRNLRERVGLSSPTPPCLLLREERDGATRFMTYLPGNRLHRHFRVAHYQSDCSTRSVDAPRIFTDPERLHFRLDDLLGVGIFGIDQPCKRGPAITNQWELQRGSRYAYLRSLVLRSDLPRGSDWHHF